jgi:hypothetical protein
MMLMLVALYSSATIVKATSATGTSIVISPDTTTPPNSTFVLNMYITNVTDMYAWSVTLVYQKIISMISVDTINGTDFTDGTGLAIKQQEDLNSSHYITYVARTLLDIGPGILRPGVNGSGLVAQFNFIAVLNGATAINCISSEILDSHSKPITPITVTTPTITVAIVQPPPSPPPSSVGGWSFSVAKASARDIDLVSIAAIAVFAIIAPAIYFKGLKRRKEKQ